MNIRSVVKMPATTNIQLLKDKIVKPPKNLSLKALVDAARLEWQESLKEFNLVDSDMVDYMIFKINAAERRYMLLLDQVKKENTAAWQTGAGDRNGL